MALVDAGIPMNDFVSASTAGYIEDTPMLGTSVQDSLIACVPITVWLVFFKDLNYVEECAGGPDLTIAALPKSRKIVYLQVRVYP